MNKSVCLKSNNPILVSTDVFLSTVNQLRKEYAEDPAEQHPLDLETAIIGHTVLEFVNDNFGTIGISLEYESEGTDCVRSFPGVGHMEDRGNSRIEMQDDFLAIYIDYKIISGKSKRLVDDIKKIAEILKSGQYNVSLKLMLSLKVSSAGRTTLLPIDSSNPNAVIDQFDRVCVSSEAFVVTVE